MRERSNRADAYFNENDMLLMREHLAQLQPADALAWVWLATTGMRLSELFAIRREEQTDNIRYVLVGRKSPATLRRVPLPDAVIERIPTLIDRPMFAGSSQACADRLGRAIKHVGIDCADGALRIASRLRARAAERLRQAGCPDHCYSLLLGYTQTTTLEGHGQGPTLAALRKWQAHVGY